MKISSSIVIPTVDSSKTIKRNIGLLEDIIKKNKFIDQYEIIISAQTSSDSTFDIIKKIRSDNIKKIFINYVI